MSSLQACLLDVLLGFHVYSFETLAASVLQKMFSGVARFLLCQISNCANAPCISLLETIQFVLVSFVFTCCFFSLLPLLLYKPNIKIIKYSSLCSSKRPGQPLLDCSLLTFDVIWLRLTTGLYIESKLSMGNWTFPLPGKKGMQITEIADVCNLQPAEVVSVLAEVDGFGLLPSG